MTEPTACGSLPLQTGVSSCGLARSALLSPVPGDDGDGIYDLPLFEAGATWFIWSLPKGSLAWDMRWGGPGLIPVPGDYDGDGISDLVVYSLTTGYWYILTMNEQMTAYARAWGGPGLIPVSGDYDGDGTSDLAVYDEARGVWHIATLDGRLQVFNHAWGGPGLKPVMHRW